MTRPSEKNDEGRISRDRIEGLLKSYRCQHQQEEDGNGSRLVDVLTPLGDLEITKGKDEIHLLADMLASELSKTVAPVSATPRSMSSAPTDGTPVLGFVPTYYQGKGAWVVVLWLHGKWMDNRAWATDPSCWLPLPAAPLDGTAKS